MANSNLSIHNIVCPTDFSEFAGSAFEESVRLARWFGAKVTVVHVTPFAVPIAGDMPVVGQLFRYDARRREKTNLMIFLKPTIVRSGADGRDFTSERYQYLQGEQQRMNPGERAFWNDPAMPTLPPEGRMPGQPGATTPGPASPPPPIPVWTSPAPAPPFPVPPDPPK